MATLTGKILADFETSLATAMAIGATTATLQSATDDDSIALPSGRYFFTLDNSNSSKEHISCALSGTSLTSIKSVSRQGVETVGVVRAHRLGATVTITDFAHILQINNLVNGTTQLDATIPLSYDGTATITTANQLIPKAYADGLAIAGSPDSSTSVKGIGRVSVAPVAPATPIFVGDNDGRVPTQAENDALLGTSGAPSTSNRYVTASDESRNYNIVAYAASSTGTDSYAITLSPVPTAYTTGMLLSFRADVANTGTASLNVNGLGARTLNKISTAGYVALSTGDILANQIIVVEFDGTNMIVISSLASSPQGIDAGVVTAIAGLTTTTTTDRTVTLAYQPRLIVVTYYVQGTTNFDSQFVVEQGVAVFSGTTLVSKNVLGESSNTGGDNLPGLSNTQGAMGNDPASTLAISVGTTTFNAIQMVLTINSVSATGFVLRFQATASGGASSKQARGKASYIAYS